MQSKIFGLIIVFMLISSFLITVSGSDYEEFKATSFSSSGNLIQGWYWLRDRNLSDKASWTFKGLPEGSGTIEAEIFALATDRAGGGAGVDARFRLLVGYPGDGNTGGVFCPQEVTLENVSPPDDPDGYKCRGTIRVDRNRQCGTSGSEIHMFAERISPNHPHVAFNKDNTVLRLRGSSDQGNLSNDAGSGSDAGDKIEEALKMLIATPPDAFNSSALVSSGIHWCNRNGHYLEWGWGSLEEEGVIVEGAVNLTLPVSNRVEGGPGFDACVEARILDSAGRELETGIVELNNPFIPETEMNSNGHGYDARGVYRFSNPNVIKSGFILRLEWPGLKNEYAFGGSIDRAIMGAILESKPETGSQVERVTVSQIIEDPLSFEGKTVTLEGEFHGWRGGLTQCPIPMTRSDWLIGEGEDYIYGTGPFPAGLSPTNTDDIGRRVIITGKITIDERVTGRVCPYFVIE